MRTPSTIRVSRPFCRATESAEQLETGDFDLELCLPDDELYGLAERTDSLAHWCQGFLHGFAAVQAELSEENQELLKDLTEISKLEMSEDELGADEEENEGYYMELSEFVRMAAVSLFLDCSKAADKDQGNTGGDDHGLH